MVTIDDSLHETTAAASDWWRRPRWLVLPLALPVFLTFGLAVGTLVNLGLNGDWVGRQGSGQLAAAELDGGGATGMGPVEACGRMQYIVETACSLKQRDRDASDIRLCVAQELKYTMWSAYGCQ
ncbi:MAG: hypothetical protein ACFCUT_02490 [Kiloniellaceae bacterium]